MALDIAASSELIPIKAKEKHDSHRYFMGLRKDDKYLFFSVLFEDGQIRFNYGYRTKIEMKRLFTKQAMDSTANRLGYGSYVSVTNYNRVQSLCQSTDELERHVKRNSLELFLAVQLRVLAPDMFRKQSNLQFLSLSRHGYVTSFVVFYPRFVPDEAPDKPERLAAMFVLRRLTNVSCSPSCSWEKMDALLEYARNRNVQCIALQLHADEREAYENKRSEQFVDRFTQMGFNQVTGEDDKGMFEHYFQITPTTSHLMWVNKNFTC
jgi:hypothetical protein